MLNTHIAALSKINSALEHLSSKAKSTDQHNTGLKSHKLVKEHLLFNEKLFTSQSDKYIDYVAEIKQNTKRLFTLFEDQKLVLSQNLLERIEEQISSLVNALNANSFMHTEALNHDKHIKEVKKMRYQKLTKTIIESSQVLYKSLSEHNEFERRLMDMLSNKERELSVCTTFNAPAISQEILVLHQRLGRCRQAISKIERSIEMQEKRN